MYKRQTLLAGVWAQGRQSALADKVVRLHVIAASDSAEDQRVKLEVRDALLAYLTPRLEAVSGAQDAAAVIAAASGALQRIAETASGGSARVELGRETYPTREYETFSLPAGVYTSLRITLGAGSGRTGGAWCILRSVHRAWRPRRRPPCSPMTT